MTFLRGDWDERADLHIREAGFLKETDMAQAKRKTLPERTGRVCWSEAPKRAFSGENSQILVSVVPKLVRPSASASRKATSAATRVTRLARSATSSARPVRVRLAPSTERSSAR